MIKYTTDGNITYLIKNFLRKFSNMKLWYGQVCLVFFLRAWWCMSNYLLNMSIWNSDRLISVMVEVIFCFFTCSFNLGGGIIFHHNNQNILILQLAMVDISLFCISMQYRTYLCDCFWHENSNSITCLQYIKINIQIIDINLMIG